MTCLNSPQHILTVAVRFRVKSERSGIQQLTPYRNKTSADKSFDWSVERHASAGCCETRPTLVVQYRHGPLHRIEQRLTDLEVKACFTEDLVDALNRLVTRQQDQIDSLVREIGRLRQQDAAAEPDGFRSLRDDLPPHY